MKRQNKLGQEEIALLAQLSECGTSIIAAVFGTPYSLASLPLFDAIVMAYENEMEAQEAAAKVIFGQLSPKGRLPVSVTWSLD